MPVIPDSERAVLVKLHALMGCVPYIQKDAENKEQRYKYLSYEAVIEKIQAALLDLKLVSIPHFETVEEREYSTKNGATWKYVRMRLNMTVIDIEAGASIEAVGEGSGTDPGDKAVPKAQTQAMKNLWCKLLNIPVGEDPEADERTDKQSFKPLTSYQTLCVIWSQCGWDVNQLPGWLSQRFKKPAEQITEDELQTAIGEVQGHLNFKNNADKVPF